MAEPWELKTDDTRTENSLTTFIIFCEDGVDEPIYFRRFQEDYSNIKVNTIENQRSGRLNLNSTVLYSDQKGLMECEQGAYKLKPDTTENIWCVYDRDLESEDLSRINPLDDIAFTTAIQTAESAGIKVAWSNDSFELWLLLHFEMVPLGTKLHRKYIYDRLTDIFKTITPKTLRLETLTGHANFNYKSSMKKKQNFILHVLPALRDRQENAIKNAELLEASFGNSIHYHNCNPYTNVHHLVLELIKEEQSD